MPENESYELHPSIPIIRVFRAVAKPGREKALAERLATSSIEVVQGQPGFLGYLVAGPANDHQREFIFASIWADAEAVKARFGEEWRVSHLPPGYAELIEACTVDHYHLTMAKVLIPAASHGVAPASCEQSATAPTNQNA